MVRLKVIKFHCISDGLKCMMVAKENHLFAVINCRDWSSSRTRIRHELWLGKKTLFQLEPVRVKTGSKAQPPAITVILRSYSRACYNVWETPVLMVKRPINVFNSYVLNFLVSAILSLICYKNYITYGFVLIYWFISIQNSRYNLKTFLCILCSF